MTSPMIKVTGHKGFKSYAPTVILLRKYLHPELFATLQFILVGWGGWYIMYIDWESQAGDPDPHYLPLLTQQKY